MSDETPDMLSNAAGDEASEATARDLDVDKLRAGRVKKGANVSMQTTCSGRDDWLPSFLLRDRQERSFSRASDWSDFLGP